MTTTYTKADLYQIVLTQLKNLTAMQDLLKIMKRQNELIENAVCTLKDEISCVMDQRVRYPDQSTAKS